MSKPKNKWICTKEKTLVTSSVMEVIQRDCQSSEDGRAHRFYLLKSSDWCNIIPVTENGKVVLVKQYRIGVSEHTLEIPGGVIDPTDPNAKEAAIRELTEETGYVPSAGARCIELGWVYPNPAIMNNRTHAFLIGPVRKEKTQVLDSGELIEIVEMTFQELLENLTNNTIAHSLIRNAFLALLLQSKEAHAILQNQLQMFTHPTSA